MTQIEPEYVYVTIPAEYICVYHRILAMLADYGEDMLKDCKASCTDRNSGVIECFNMFNAAVAARKLGKDKLAETLIKYIKAKINQIYEGRDNSTSFVFPIDENGEIKAFVSCGERPKFYINPDDGDLYAHKFGNGFEEHFKLGIEDESWDDEEPTPPEPETGLSVQFTPRYDVEGGTVHPCGDLVIKYDGVPIQHNKCIIEYYFDDVNVEQFEDITITSSGLHNFKVVVTYRGETKISNEDLNYESSN